MRGYYRAVKRGVPWAVAISRKKGMDFIFAIQYRNVDLEEIIRGPSLFDFIKKANTGMFGGYITVPLKIGKE